jgi:hypothetical protein
LYKHTTEHEQNYWLTLRPLVNKTERRRIRDS